MSLKDLFIRPENTPKKKPENNNTANDRPTRETRREDPVSYQIGRKP